MLEALRKRPVAVGPRPGWPAWAVIPAAFGILTLAALIGVLVAWGYSSLAGLGFPQAADAATLAPAVAAQLTTWTAGFQVGVIVLTLLAAGLFSSNRGE